MQSSQKPLRRAATCPYVDTQVVWNVLFPNNDAPLFVKDGKKKEKSVSSQQDDRLSTPRILVADDDLRVIESYQKILGGHDILETGSRTKELDQLEGELFGKPASREDSWRVDFVTQGLEAVEAVRSAKSSGDPYSLIVLDIKMPPGVDGYETAKLIRKIDSTAFIVYISGYTDYSIEQLTEAGAPRDKVRVLIKPVSPESLKAFVRECVSSRQ